MKEFGNITKPDIATLKLGDEILIRANVVSACEGANLRGIVVKSMAYSENVKDTYFWVDSGCYFGKIEPEISVGDRFKYMGNEGTVISIHKDKAWIEWQHNSSLDTRIISFLKTLERIPK